jgi:hypothetical protein
MKPQIPSALCSRLRLQLGHRGVTTCCLVRAIDVCGAMGNDNRQGKPRKLAKMSAVFLFCHHESGVMLPGLIPMVRDGTRAVVS